MFRVIKYVLTMAFILVVFATTLAPALQRVITTLQSVMVSNDSTSTVISNTETFLFIGMPLLFIGGALVLAFFVAVGLRGTSFR